MLCKRAGVSGYSVCAVGLAFAVVLSAGCAPLESSDSPQGGSGTLVVDLPGEPSTLDPGLQYDTSSYPVYRNIFDQLLARDPETREVAPWIATSWERRSPTEWTFRIRDRVEFHNGEKLTASDVAYSLNRILDPGLASPQSANYEQVESAKASGNRLSITTKAPSPTLLDQLVNLSIVPEEYVERVGDERFNLEPVGSGAYRLDKWNKGTDVVLQANARYWDGRPRISGVRFRAVPNGATRVADLQSGEAQVATAMTPDDLKTIEGSENLKALSEPSERVAYMTLNHLADTPTQDRKVRQAIAHAVDREEIISSLLEGYAEPVGVTLTPAAFGYTDEVEGYDYDPERARQLLEEAGHGGVLELSMPTTPAYDQRVVEALQADLQEVGIELDVRTYDLATYLQRVQDPEREWGSVGYAQWSCSCLDADGTVYPVFHTGSIWSSYSNEEFDRLVEDARTTFDEAERERLYREAFGVLDEDVAAVPLWQVYAHYGVSSDLEWQPDAQESFFVRDMKLAG